MDYKFEVAVIPVADVDRARDFYPGLGWRLDADFAPGPDFRVVQLTPPGSACAVIFGTGVTTAVPGSTQGLQLVADDTGLADALRRAEASHAKYEEEAGRPDPDWPVGGARYMADESARAGAGK